MTTPGKILVIGGASLVGRHLVAHLGGARSVATVHRARTDGGIHFDALTMSPDALAEAAEGCSHAVLLLANARPDDCARDPAAARRLNVEAIAAIVERLHRWRIMPVFTSTEAVFDGRHGSYRETDMVGPLMTYAAQKMEVERLLQAADGPWLTLRLGRVVSDNPADDTMFSQWLRQIRGGEDIRCATDHIFSPIHAEDVASAAVALMDVGHTGLFHLGGPEGLPRIAMLQRLIGQWREAGGRYDGTVIPCRMDDFPTLEPRPRNISLCSEKLILASGVRPRGVGTICRQLVAASLNRDAR